MGLISILQGSAVYIVIICFIMYGIYYSLPYILDSIEQIKKRGKENRPTRSDKLHGTPNNRNKESNN